MKDIKAVLINQRKFFDSGETSDLTFRRKQLETLKAAINKNEAAILDALKKDLNKSPFEAYATEIGMVLEEIRFMLRNLDRLARPERVRTPLMHFPSTSKVYKEPYGVVLIMSPWNYPFQLSLTPLVGALAAGNCAIIKPSNYSPHTSALIRKIMGECFDEGLVAVVEGGRDVNQSLLEQKFDYIFFTGSVSVGKTVMAAAAKHLTPVTLELGGKSPCIVDETADIALAAKRIAWGKFINAGQTCVAPDYILVHKSIKKQLIEELQKSIKLFYGEEPHKHPEYPKIISQKHYDRLIALINGGRSVTGGRVNPETLQIEPAILEDADWDSPVMQEEIFGPILPVIEFDRMDEIVPLINSRPKPLALYLFTASKTSENYILRNVPFGGGCVNDTIVHVASALAFGGVGESGMGSYHGEDTFYTFTHRKGVLKKSSRVDIPFRYPPYKDKLGLLKKILK